MSKWKVKWRLYKILQTNRVEAGTVESNEVHFLFGKVGDTGTC